MRPSPTFRLTTACLLFMLTGCGPTGWDAPYRTYLERLSRTLEETYAEPDTPVLTRMPRPAKLIHSFETDRLDGLDFLALHGCALQQTIGKRNSSLGRMARDSQRLLLELEFLQLAPGCIAQLQAQDKSALAATLQQAWDDKQQQLPQRIFNATLAGEEYRAFWQPRGPGTLYPGNTSSAVLEAVGQINASVRRWLGGDYRFDNQDFEILLSEVAKGDGGELWHALSLQNGWLESADALLSGQLAKGPLCADNIRPPAADILPNVISRFFIDDIQPRAAEMGRRQHQLFPPLLALEQLLMDALPQPYRKWKQDREATLARLATAPRRHVEQLGRILKPCSKPDP